MIDSLGLVVLLLAMAVLVVVLFRSIHLPALIAYLLIGVAVGPSGWGLVASSREISHLAEFGVVFLLFTIGLEFSLPRLVQMRRIVVGMGGLQLILTASVIALLIGVITQCSWQVAVIIGTTLAMSSTAIVVHLLAERHELDMPHGRHAFGVLLFQDLAVVPLLIVIPALAGASGSMSEALGWAAIKAAVALSLILVVGQYLMRRWFHLIAARRSNELFILNLLLVTLGLAWITDWAGLTLALGAFLAGMLISETEYRHQVEEDIKPFRDVLLGLFFLTVGMQLDWSIVAREGVLLLGLVVGQLVIKIAIVWGLSRLFRNDAGVAMRTALALAPGGEFSLVLATVVAANQLVEPQLMQPVVASVLLTMMLGPVLIQNSDRIAMRLVRSEWMTRSLALHQLALRSFGMDRHIVLCGYGRTGQSIARFLDRLGVRYFALDIDPTRVREAQAAGESVVFGDAGRREILVAAGLLRASAVVVTFADSGIALKILAHAREARPNVPVIVRTVDDVDLDRLTDAGATEVVPDTFESSLMLASHALVLIGIPVRRVLHQLRTVRDDRYASLRGFFHGETDDAELLEDAHQRRLHSVVLDEGAYAIGRTIRDLELSKHGVTITTLRRANQKTPAPGAEVLLQKSDVLVIMGDADSIAAAELKLIQGST